MKTRFPATLIVSLCAPLVTIALARLGAGPLATYPTLGVQSPSEAQIDEDTLLINAISVYSQQAEWANSPTQSRLALARARALVPHLRTPRGQQVALRRLSRAQPGKMPTCALKSPGTSRLLSIQEATP